MKLKFGDAVRVVWIDACGTSGGWKKPYTEGVEIRNVGVFVHKNRNGVCIAKGVDLEDKELVLEPSFIPAGMVRTIRKLR